MGSVSKAVTRTMAAIDEESDSRRMSINEYIEFLEEVIGALEIRKDAAEEDLQRVSREEN